MQQIKIIKSKKLKSKKNSTTSHLIPEIPSWISTFKFNSTVQNKKDKSDGLFYILSANESAEHIVNTHALDFQKETLNKSDKDALHFIGKSGPVWILKIKKILDSSHSNHFIDSDYTQARDGAGSIVPLFKAFQLKNLKIEFVAASEDVQLGTLVGLELGAYNFKTIYDGTFDLASLPSVTIVGGSKEVLFDAKAISNSINWARHWTNLPGNILNPATMEISIKNLFSKAKYTKLEIWDSQKLKKENMGLHLAVGGGALHEPRLMILKYRPKNSKVAKEAPFVFVGKGITFDTGGLDLKPSSAMRLMKKDMGGAATVAGLSLWVEATQYPHPCDFYIALAENSVSEKAMRPGDIYQAKNGMHIEIHNTDAEGRLVLADAITAALENLNGQKPKCLIDVATLTGAIKVALGSDLTGMFTNNDEFAEVINEAGKRTGDLNWRMPLVPKYAAQMNSSVAALTNAVDGFGGAITAALFLEKFVEQVPWIHLDIYAWADKPMGALTTAGGSGQGVQALIGFLSICENEKTKTAHD